MLVVVRNACKQKPHRPGISPALGLPTGRDVPQTMNRSQSCL
jgi:hypothetical protein